MLLKKPFLNLPSGQRKILIRRKTLERRLSELTREENFIGKSVNLRKLNLNSKYIYIYCCYYILGVYDR